MALIDLGCAMARLKKIDRTPHCIEHRLEIVYPAVDEGNYRSPAESVTIYGEPALIALRDALNEAYPAEEAEAL